MPFIGGRGGAEKLACNFSGRRICLIPATMMSLTTVFCTLPMRLPTVGDSAQAALCGTGCFSTDDAGASPWARLTTCSYLHCPIASIGALTSLGFFPLTLQTAGVRKTFKSSVQSSPAHLSLLCHGTGDELDQTYLTRLERDQYCVLKPVPMP